MASKRDAITVVMAGLVPAIHVFFEIQVGKKDVDARHEAGHDDLFAVRSEL
jgi:hypothetical protein